MPRRYPVPALLFVVALLASACGTPAAATPVAGCGLNASKLGTTGRADGGLQVPYYGAPLYLFSKDTVAGGTNGENILHKWFVVSATGSPIRS